MSEEEFRPANYHERLEYYRKSGVWRAAWWDDEIRGMRYYDRDRDCKPALLKLKVELLEY